MLHIWELAQGSDRKRVTRAICMAMAVMECIQLKKDKCLCLMMRHKLYPDISHPPAKNQATPRKPLTELFTLPCIKKSINDKH